MTMETYFLLSTLRNRQVQNLGYRYVYLRDVVDPNVVLSNVGPCVDNTVRLWHVALSYPTASQTKQSTEKTNNSQKTEL